MAEPDLTGRFGSVAASQQSSAWTTAIGQEQTARFGEKLCTKDRRQEGKRETS